MVPSLRSRTVAARTGDVVRAVAFWSAVVLPAAVLAALVAGDLPLVGLLLAGNAAALVVGHDHRTPAAGRRRNHAD